MDSTRAAGGFQGYTSQSGFASVQKQTAPSVSPRGLSSLAASMETTALTKRLAELERAISHEIGRRGELEVWVTRQVEVKAQTAVSSALGAIESHLLDRHRDLAQDVRERVLVLEAEVGSIRSRVGRLEKSAGYGSSAGKHNSEAERLALERLQERITLLERRVEHPEKLPTEMIRQIKLTCAPMVEDCALRSEKSAERAASESTACRTRMIELERWLSEVITPELLRLSVRSGQAVEDVGTSPAGAGRQATTGRRAAEQRERREALQTVFELADLDGNGDLDQEEILEIAERRARGKRMGNWTNEMHQAMLDSLDANGDGMVSRKEFVDHFAAKLPHDMAEFREEVRYFTEAAQQLRAFKKKLHADLVHAKTGDRSEQLHAQAASSGQLQDDPGLNF
eukprot:TRINITY_DN57463_c0_g1_i2.p1 TRINITY_DN57463_c0_g1~~TRINITY_DN57463_c0_g1_i2.p1  ORF type:complete len:398 (-),score=71.52 TRINITY_DN57463_c0_g1_i2:240-1433(-)